MKCYTIDKKYRTKFTSIALTIFVIVFCGILTLSVPQLTSFFSNKITIISIWFIINTLVLISTYYDASSLCSVFKTYCKEKYFLLSFIRSIFVACPFLFFTLKLFTNDVKTRLLFVAAYALVRLLFLYIRYNSDPKKVMENPNNIMRCPSFRLMVYFLIFFIDIILGYQTILTFNVKNDIQTNLGFNKNVALFLTILYIIIVMIIPYIQEIINLNESIVYDMDEIKTS
jgi:hypothetical protein